MSDWQKTALCYSVFIECFCVFLSRERTEGKEEAAAAHRHTTQQLKGLSSRRRGGSLWGEKISAGRSAELSAVGYLATIPFSFGPVTSVAV